MRSLKEDKIIQRKMEKVWFKMGKSSRAICLASLLFFYKVCISRYISIWHIHQQFLENVHQFIYLEGGVERRVWGTCFLYIAFTSKLFPHQSCMLPTLFSFHYTKIKDGTTHLCKHILFLFQNLRRSHHLQEVFPDQPPPKSSRLNECLLSEF